MILVETVIFRHSIILCKFLSRTCYDFHIIISCVSVIHSIITAMAQVPPLPKSLAINSPIGIDQIIHQNHQRRDIQVGQLSVGNSRIDEKLQNFKQEMIGLRQLDLSLLSQLNVLNEKIIDYKRMLSEDLRKTENNDNDTLARNQSGIDCPSHWRKNDRTVNDIRDDDNDDDNDDHDDHGSSTDEGNLTESSHSTL